MNSCLELRRNEVQSKSEMANLRGRIAHLHVRTHLGRVRASDFAKAKSKIQWT